MEVWGQEEKLQNFTRHKAGDLDAFSASSITSYHLPFLSTTPDHPV